MNKNEKNTINKYIINTIKVSVLCIISLLLISSSMLAATSVSLIEPEVKDIEDISLVNGRIVPYQEINISSKTGGIIETLNVEIGEYVEEGESLIEFDQEDIRAQFKQADAAYQIAEANHEKLLKGASDEQIRIAEAGEKQAEAALKIAEANYKMLKDGATEEDLESVRAQYQQAVSSYEGAINNLELLEKTYNDRTMQRQQLSAAETQLKSAEKQVGVAEERMKQARIGLQQAENGLEQASSEYERTKYLYEENVVTKQQYEMAETQYKNAQSTVENAKSAVESARIAGEQASVSLQGAEENYNIANENFNNPTQLEQQLAGARTQLEVAEANKKMAGANLDRVEKGAREEELATAAANVEQAESALEQARAQLDQVKEGATDEDVKISEANMRQAEAALQQVKNALEDSVIKSPISGIVAQLTYDEGEMASPGTPLLVLINLDQVYIQADVTADLLIDISPGDTVRAKILAYQDKYLEGTINYISPTADQRTQAFTVKVLAENPDHIVRGGMFTELYFSRNQLNDTLVLPIETILDIENSPYLFIVNNGKAERRSVTLGIIKNHEVAVVEGLEKDDKVVVRGQNSLVDGASVEVIE